MVVGDNAKASVLMCAHSLSDVESLSNGATEVFVGLFMITNQCRNSKFIALKHR